MNILVTGANGYIGSRIVESLKCSGYEVTALVRAPMPTHNPWPMAPDHLVTGDIRDPQTLEQLCNLKIQGIIHTISLLPRNYDRLSSNDSFAINVLPAWNLLNILAKGPLKFFLYLSTQQVYAPLSATDISENYPTLPHHQYGLTHLLSEQIIDFFGRSAGITCTSLRLTNCVGAPLFLDSNCWTLVAHEFCKSAFHKEVIKIHSDGTTQKDFISLKDVCGAITHLLACLWQVELHKAYNLGSSKTITVFELAEIVQRLTREVIGKSVEIQLDCTPAIEAQAAPRYRYDCRELEMLGFSPQHSFEDAIKDQIEFLKLHYSH